MRYRNTDSSARSWPNLTHPHGHSLGLEPDEEVELDDGIEDPWLKPVDVEPPPYTPVTEVEDEVPAPAPESEE